MEKGRKVSPSPTLGWKNQRGSIPEKRRGRLSRGAAETPVSGRQRHQETSERHDIDPGRKTQTRGRKHGKTQGKNTEPQEKEHRDTGKSTETREKEQRDPGREGAAYS